MAINNSIDLNVSGIVIASGSGTFSSTSVTQNAVLVGGASNAISSIALTNGQMLIGSTGSSPVAATLTAGSGISLTSGAGTLQVNVSGGGLTWTDVSGTSQAMSSGNGYTSDNAGLVTLTLPTTIAYGNTIAVVGQGAGGWKIAQNAGQIIHFGSAADTTTGTGGSLASTNRRDCVTLLCVVANTEFTVMSSIGNITIV